MQRSIKACSASVLGVLECFRLKSRRKGDIPIRYDHEMEILHLSHALPLTQVLTPAFEPVPGFSYVSSKNPFFLRIWRMRFLAGIIPIAVAIFVFLPNHARLVLHTAVRPVGIVYDACTTHFVPGLKLETSFESASCLILLYRINCASQCFT